MHYKQLAVCGEQRDCFQTTLTRTRRACTFLLHLRSARLNDKQVTWHVLLMATESVLSMLDHVVVMMLTAACKAVCWLSSLQPGGINISTNAAPSHALACTSQLQL